MNRFIFNQKIFVAGCSVDGNTRPHSTVNEEMEDFRTASVPSATASSKPSDPKYSLKPDDYLGLCPFLGLVP